MPDITTILTPERLRKELLLLPDFTADDDLILGYLEAAVAETAELTGVNLKDEADAQIDLELDRSYRFAGPVATLRERLARAVDVTALAYEDETGSVELSAGDWYAIRRAGMVFLRIKTQLPATVLSVSVTYSRTLTESILNSYKQLIQAIVLRTRALYHGDGGRGAPDNVQFHNLIRSFTGRAM